MSKKTDSGKSLTPLFNIDVGTGAGIGLGIGAAIGAVFSEHWFRNDLWNLHRICKLPHFLGD